MDPAVAERDGTNVCLGEVVRKGKSVRPGTPLEGRYVGGTASDLFVQGK